MVVHPKLYLELIELAQHLEGVLELHEQVDQLVVVLRLYRLLPRLLSPSFLPQPPCPDLYRPWS